jgi:apolipoprotein N-acyltransferase
VRSKAGLLLLDWRWGAAAATGVALNLAQSVTPWWPAMWVAPVPLLCALLFTHSLRETAQLATLSSLLGRITTLLPIVRGATIDQSLEIAVVALLIIVPFAVPLVAIAAVWRSVVTDARAWYSPLAFSLIAASVDFLFAIVSSHGTWSSWANSQMNVLPVLQSAALGGTPLVVFVVTLPAATAAVAIARGRAIQSPVWAYGLPVSLTIAAIAYGYGRLADPPAMARIPIGLVASDYADLFPSDPGGASDRTLGAYLERATMLAARGAALVMLPEKIEIFEDSATDRVRNRLSMWASDHHTRLLAGFGIVKAEYRDNIAWLFDHNGELMTDYSKQHLVPLLEMRFRPGDRDAIVEIDGHRFGIAICKDLGFPRLARRYGRAGVDAMLAPAWDFVSDGEYHSRMAVLRGIEQGFSVIRTANQGMLTLSDPYGRIVAEAESNQEPVTTLLADAPIGSVPTVYRKLGDAFGWVCVVVVVVLAMRRQSIPN